MEPAACRIEVQALVDSELVVRHLADTEAMRPEDQDLLLSTWQS